MLMMMIQFRLLGWKYTKCMACKIYIKAVSLWERYSPAFHKVGEEATALPFFL